MRPGRGALAAQSSSGARSSSAASARASAASGRRPPCTASSKIAGCALHPPQARVGHKKSLCDPTLAQIVERAACCRPRDEGAQVVGRVDIEAETRQRQDPWRDALRPRGFTVGLETVVAKGEAQHAGRRAEHAVGAAPVVRRHQGHGRPVVARALVRRQHRLDLVHARAGHVARYLEQAFRPRRGSSAAAALSTAALWPSLEGSVSTRAPWRAASAAARSSRVTTTMSDSPGNARKGLQHVFRHREGEALALGRVKKSRQPLLGVARVLDRKDRPRSSHRYPLGYPQGPPPVPASRVPVRDARKKAETCQTKRTAGPGHTPAQAMVRRTAASTSSTLGM